jgi:hypothetical protein
MRLALEKLVTTPSTLNYLSENAYDFTKWNLGKGIIYNNGGTSLEKYIAPQFSVIRPVEESVSFTVAYVFVHNFSPTIDYIFGVALDTAASASRRIALWQNNKKTGAVSWVGFITLTLATATAHTVRDFKIDVKNESVGTVAASGTAVTGVSTLFATNKIAVGARIGFGSTDPEAITQWYRIATRTSDTALVLTTSAGTISAGTPYVIQEFRPVYIATNATTTNGGIHIAKGVSIEDFTAGGTTIALGTTVDDVKAVYWLKDAATQTNIVSAGSAIDFAAATPTSLTCYAMDLVSAGNYKFYVYNLRATLTLTAGATTNAWILATGNNPITGTGTQNASVSIATTNHGTGSGVKCLYLNTTTRIYRVPVTRITTTSTTVFSSPSDVIAEIPIGGVNTFGLTSALSTVEYISDCDAFIFGTTHTAGIFSYFSQYVNSGQQFQNAFGRDYRYLEQSTKDNGHPSLFNNQSTVCSYYDNSGTNLVYIVKQGTIATTNNIYITAFGADKNYANSNQGYVISPEIVTSNALKYYRAFCNHINLVGTGNLAKPTEPFDVYIRTANIQTDATSGWNLIAEDNDISSFAGAASVQFKILFKTIGESCLPARILGINLSYENNTTDSHFAFSREKSSVTAKEFGFRFKTAFGGTVPNLRISLFNDVTGGSLGTDTTASPTQGTWGKSTDGTTWGAYDTTDKANETTYIRYTPTSIADNIIVAAYITLA